MHSLSVELAQTSDAIAKTMAEAAAADLSPHSQARASPPAAGLPSAGEAQGTPAAVAAGAADAGDATASPSVDDGNGATKGETGLFGMERRSRADAQAEVERLKARQSELFEMIQEEKEVR